jgi:hypothetical protein
VSNIVSHSKVGRKSAIKHAQEWASHEVCQGKQKLITWVLRAGMTSHKVSQ